MMKELIDFVSKNRNKIDPIILAGLFHKQFVIIHPFIDGNGRTVRLVTKSVLADLGIDTFNLFSFENYYNRNVSTYFQKVGVRGNYYDIYKNQILVPFLSYIDYLI
jgi:Fic family protein